VSASLPLLAGSVSTAIFVFSTLPMLVKAGRTKDLASYSLGNIVLANVGNLIYAVYVLSLPLGPIWALHGFHLGATGLMLFWYLRHARQRRPRRARPRDSTWRPVARARGSDGPAAYPLGERRKVGRQCVPDDPVIDAAIVVGD
jgi:uncharacterized protein with PQ loop repeat